MIAGGELNIRVTPSAIIFVFTCEWPQIRGVVINLAEE